MNCPKCGAQNEDDAVFCAVCGVNISEAKAEKPEGQQPKQPNMQNPYEQQPKQPFSQSTNTYNQQPQQPNPNQYGQQPQQPYPNQYGQQPQQSVMPEKFNKAATIVALVFSFVLGGNIISIILSIIAITKSSKYDTAVQMGNYGEANDLARSAKKLTIISFVFEAIFLVLYIILWATVFSAMMKSGVADF